MIRGRAVAGSFPSLTFGVGFPVLGSQVIGRTRRRGGCLTVFGNLFILDADHWILAIGTAGETACPTLLDQSFGEVGGAGGFACRWKLISIAHPNPENGYSVNRPYAEYRIMPRSPLYGQFETAKAVFQQLATRHNSSSPQRRWPTALKRFHVGDSRLAAVHGV